MKALAILLVSASAAFAQVPAFNAAGVSMGHHHLNVTDPAAHKKIWVEALGGQASGNPGLELVKLPGTFLILSLSKPSGGSEGSSLDHFAFAVKDYDGTRDRLAAAGVKIVRDRAQAPREFVAMFPDDVKVEFYEDTALATPIAHHPSALPHHRSGRFARVVGEGLRCRGRQEGTRTVTTIPGATLAFTKVDAAAPPTRGRSLDHTGVNVKNVNDYCQKLTGMGIVCERPRGSDVPIAMVTDPAGTRIEINQGLESR